MLQYVRTLAEIQASPFQPHAPVRSSEVFSYSGTSRKKRSEIALTVNNHSTGIYDVSYLQVGFLKNLFHVYLDSIWEYHCLICRLTSHNLHLPSMFTQAQQEYLDRSPKNHVLLCLRPSAKATVLRGRDKGEPRPGSSAQDFNIQFAKERQSNRAFRSAYKPPS